ncbi:phospholipase B1, membrane-associated [Polypterus senegalus]|uniref:phospholipase B1, membrane-associated n=1 Tax=Polypterus senegalus TaxID=55291 RepID=UPI0019642BE0|nr:phospholipase B1, membrane-associated [Polypterus senegalus]XP_039597986.1 phospholipase B1, membrane-associated [Polypterus senegalus]
MLYNEMPRCLVNLVQVLPLEALREVNNGGLGCILQKSFCSCLVRPTADSPELKELIELNGIFQQKVEELIASGRFDKDDFTVILQPYLTEAQPPRDQKGNIDFSFFAPDCFHFSVKGHEELAKGLWNNMFQPEGSKDKLDYISEPIQLICPTKAHPYIYTKYNSVHDNPTALGKVTGNSATSFKHQLLLLALSSICLLIIL